MKTASANNQPRFPLIWLILIMVMWLLYNKPNALYPFTEPLFWLGMFAAAYLYGAITAIIKNSRKK